MTDGRNNLAAFTAPHCSYPPYVSVNEHNDCVEIIVRSPSSSDGPCGATASMTMSKEAFTAFLKDLIGAHACMTRADSFSRTGKEPTHE